MRKKLCITLICIMLMQIFVTPVFAANIEKTELKAGLLKKIGLFKGVSDTDFALTRVPTRAEAVTMLVRVLGKEKEALEGEYDMPFTDVKEWASKYVGYAYENGLTKGKSETLFGSEDKVSANQYLTFMLRALGYKDSAFKGDTGDFQWDDPSGLSREIGLLTDDVNTDNFLRADIVCISYQALEIKLKNHDEMLVEKLIDGGAFTWDDYSQELLRIGPMLERIENNEPVRLATGSRTFTFTIVNQVDYLNAWLSDGGDGFVELTIIPNRWTTTFTCESDIDFENIQDLKFRYIKYTDEQGSLSNDTVIEVGPVVNNERYRVELRDDRSSYFIKAN